MASRFLYLVRHGEAIDEGVLSDVGRQQAHLIGERLKDVPFSAIHHSPLPRAAETARLMAEHLSGVPTYPSDVVGDYLPSAPDRVLLPEPYAEIVDSYSPEEVAEGAELAAAALERYAVPAEEDTHELVVTHNFLIGWFVARALEAPDRRWLGMNQCNCGLTVILYRPGRPAALMCFNDVGHLPQHLRWTGFPVRLAV